MPTPSPTPTPTPTPSPTPTPTSGPCAGLTPATNFEARNALANSNTSGLHQGVVGRVYSYPLPKGVNGLYNSGFLQQSDSPGTPTELTVEWGISQCPGDFTYYTSQAAAITGGRGGVSYPCGGVNGAATGAYYWSLAGSNYECRIDNTQQWYINVRYLNGCPLGVSCPVSYYHSEY